MMERFNNLPKEIRLEILSRLPIESVLDCKLVCKPWRDLIHHPSFSQLHLNQINSANDSGKLSFIFLNHVEKLKLYYAEYDETLVSRKTRMNLNPLFNDVYIASSSHNGLICFETWSRSMSDNVNCGPALICNPITREYILLPNSTGEHLWTGFGYSSSTNEYKVVRICSGLTDPNFGITQVYTLGSGSGWRNVGKIDVIKSISQQGAFANGALHWANHQEGTIHAFHLADEKFSELSCPPCLAPGVSAFSVKLGVLGDCLSVVYYSTDGDCDVWLLMKNKDNCDDLSWSKEFSISNCMNMPFGFTKSGRLLCYGCGYIHSYDPKASSAEVVCVGKYITRVTPHKNTLVSLKVLGENDTKTMESGESPSSIEETENSDQLK